jgi:hypothetical protein
MGVAPGTSFSDKPGQAQNYPVPNDKKDTCVVLRAFIREVKATTKSTAPPFVPSATRIRAVLVC